MPKLSTMLIRKFKIVFMLMCVISMFAVHNASGAYYTGNLFSNPGFDIVTSNQPNNWIDSLGDCVSVAGGYTNKGFRCNRAEAFRQDIVDLSFSYFDRVQIKVRPTLFCLVPVLFNAILIFTDGSLSESPNKSVKLNWNTYTFYSSDFSGYSKTIDHIEFEVQYSCTANDLVFDDAYYRAVYPFPP